jgi:hypothetical protein
MTVLDVDAADATETAEGRLNHYVCGLAYCGTPLGGTVESLCGLRIVRVAGRPYPDMCRVCVDRLASFSCPTFGVCPDRYRCWTTD